MTTVRNIIEQVYTKVNGEYELMSEASDDFKTYLNVLNQVMEIWARTPYVKWQSLYNPNYTLDEVVADGEYGYTMDTDVLRVANSPYDNIYFVDSLGEVVDTYKMADQATFDSTKSKKVAAALGHMLYLKSVPANIVGTNIRVPVYTLPPKYALGIEEVAIDSVPWLVSYMSAFLCDASPVPFISRNADKYYKQAEGFMREMKENNRRRQHLVIKSAVGNKSSTTWAEVLPTLTIKDL